MKIKAIETEYKGCRFRSRLEARWAVFLDAFNEEWHYEVEGYELLSGRYLPDFWLPQLCCWLEIKGEKPTELEEQLCCELADGTDKPVAIAWGLPFAAVRNQIGIWPRYVAERLKVYCMDTTDFGGGNSWWEESFWSLNKKGDLCICSNNDWDHRCFMTPNYESFDGMVLVQDIQGPILESHVNKAKGARFEYQR